MKHWIPFPRVEGRASRQAHVDLPEGTFEREMGREGFYGPSAQLHHRHPPTGWLDWQGPLRPRAFDLARVEDTVHSPWDAFPVLANERVKVRLWRTEGAMDHCVRNADGDELLFVHAGEGDLFCDFGHLAFTEGDYIVLPRGTTWRLGCAGRAAFLMIEATEDSFGLPEKGIVGQHAVFDPAVLDVPEIDGPFEAQQDEREWRVEIKRREQRSTVTYPFNPLDTVGWHGTLAPVRINWRDIRPLMSHRVHLPPSAHTTFLAERFVVCTFCPRPIETDPGALKVPFFHSNIDYDEVIFYHAGDFFSRDNIHPGMMSLHPAGFPHGPHPKAFRAGAKAARKKTNKITMMIDTRDPLEVADAALTVEWSEYVHSWREEPGAMQGAEPAPRQAKGVSHG